MPVALVTGALVPVQEIKSPCGDRLDLLLNNAAYQAAKDIEELTADEMNDTPAELEEPATSTRSRS